MDGIDYVFLTVNGSSRSDSSREDRRDPSSKNYVETREEIIARDGEREFPYWNHFEYGQRQGQ